MHSDRTLWAPCRTGSVSEADLTDETWWDLNRPDETWYETWWDLYRPDETWDETLQILMRSDETSVSCSCSFQEFVWSEWSFSKFYFSSFSSGSQITSPGAVSKHLSDNLQFFTAHIINTTSSSMKHRSLHIHLTVSIRFFFPLNKK